MFIFSRNVGTLVIPYTVFNTIYFVLYFLRYVLKVTVTRGYAGSILEYQELVVCFLLFTAVLVTK